MREHRTCLSGALCLLLLCAAARADTPAWYKPELKRGPYVQRVSATGCAIVWRTLGDITPVVKFGAKPDTLTGKCSGDGVTVVRELQAAYTGGNAPDGVVQYEANLSGLRPHTFYYYALYDGDRLLAGGESFQFRTAPEIGKAAPLRFVAFGDSGVGSWGQRQTYLAFRDLFTAEGRREDLWLGLGDVAQGRGSDLEYQSVVFGMYGDALRHTPYWCTPGNHDIIKIVDGKGVGPYCDAFLHPINGECGGVPSGTRAYYSFDYGRVHFISLNTYQESREPDGPMVAWLRKDCAATRASGKTDWIIAFTHAPHSLSSLGMQPPSIEFRKYIMPVLEDAGVDLVLGGHIHNYQRSVLIDGAYNTPAPREGTILDDGDGNPDGDGAYRKSAGLAPHNGTVAVVVGTGGGGTFLESVGPFTKKALCEYGVLAVDIDGDTLNARFINLDGHTLDRFRIVKKGTVKPTPVKNPKPVPEMTLRRRLWGIHFQQIPYVEDPIVLDGRYDNEAVWREKALKADFGSFYSALLLAREDGLYIGCHWGNARSRITAKHRDDTLKLDSGFEIEIDANHDRETYYRFHFNEAGTRADSRNDDYTYNPEWDIVRQLDVTPEMVKNLREMGLKLGGIGEAYTAEVRIPWKAIGLDGPPKPEKPMGMNIIAHTSGWTWFWFQKHGRYEQITPPDIFGTVRVAPGKSETVINHYEEWAYRTGDAAPAGWTAPDFDDTQWERGNAGFGYGDLEAATTLTDMKGRYRRVRVRREFEIKDPAEITELHLMMNYDDAFICTINGREVLRKNTDGDKITVHEGTGPPYDWEAHKLRVQRDTVAMVLPGKPLYHEYFALPNAAKLLKEGKNVIAIEGINASLDSKAFMLDPYLCATRKGGAQ